MADQVKRKRRSFSEQFKRDAANLILVEGYSASAAAKAVGVDNRTMRAWRDKFAAELPPAAKDATVEELQDEVKRLRKQLREAELDNEILKKATAYFAKESQ